MSVLNIAFGALGLLTGIVVFLAVAGGGFLSGEMETMAITSTVGTAVAAFFALFSVPAIVGGWRLWQRKSWARILVLVLLFIVLLNIPMGTVIGIHSIGVLLHAETVALFGGQTVEQQPAVG